MKPIATILLLFFVLSARTQTTVIPYELKGKWFCFADKYDPGKKGAGRYDKIEYIGDGVYQVWSKRKAGLVDKYGKILLPPEYLPLPTIVEFSEGMYPLQKDGKILFFTNTGELAYEWKFEEPPYEFEYYSNGLLDTENGFVDKKGRIAFTLPDRHNSLNGLNKNGLIQASIKKRENRRLIFTGRYYSLDMYCKGALYMASSSYDNYDERLRRTSDNKLIDSDYNNIYNFPGNRIIAQKPTAIHVIDSKGRKVMRFPGSAEIVSDYEQGRYRIKTNKKTCVYDGNDKKLFCLAGYSLFSPVNGYANGYVINDPIANKKGFVDLKGNILVQPVYDSVVYEEDLGVWLVEINKQKFYIDDKGNKYYDSN